MGFTEAVASVLGFAGQRRLRRLEAPIDTVRRRVEDHKTWWQKDLLANEGREAPPQIADGQESERPDS